MASLTEEASLPLESENEYFGEFSIHSTFFAAYSPLDGRVSPLSENS